MSPEFSRRSLLKGIFDGRGLGCFACEDARAGGSRRHTHGIQRPPRSRDAPEGPNTPKICAPLAFRDIEKSMRQVRQIGVNNVSMGGPKMPWQEADLQGVVDKLKTGGLVAGNMMIAGFNNCIYGRAGAERDKERTLRPLSGPRAKWIYRSSNITGTRTGRLKAITSKKGGAEAA